MYRKNANGWLKHIDFIILDMICLQIAFVVAYFIKNGNIHLYNNFLYRNMAIIIELADLMVLLLDYRLFYICFQFKKVFSFQDLFYS